MAAEAKQGFYSIVVDDGIEQWFDGFLNQDQVQGILYTSSGLSRGQHKVVGLSHLGKAA